MKRFTLATAMLLLLSFASSAWSQEVVFNGDFETQTYTSLWTLTGDNVGTKIGNFTVSGQKKSYCLRRAPGTPSGNGGIEQTVHLYGGVEYHFFANIAAFESG